MKKYAEILSSKLQFCIKAFLLTSQGLYALVFPFQWKINVVSKTIKTLLCH